MSNPTRFTHGYALLIGVGADLPVTIRDASGLRDILVDPQRCAYPPEQVRLLTEAEANRTQILAGLDWLSAAAQSDPAATVLIYFSGHGGGTPESYLLAHGWQRDNLAATAVSATEFTAKLAAIRSRKLLTLLDCCHAGAMAEVKGAGLSSVAIPSELDAVLGAGSGRVVIASSRRDEYSYTGKPYSIFTQALREALAGYGAADRDGYAYVADVALYVGRVVPERSKWKQHPILKLAGADNFAIAWYASGDSTPKRLPDTPHDLLPFAAVDLNLMGGYRDVLKQHQYNLLRVEERMAVFIDQASIPLDLERTREGILKRIREIENTIMCLAQEQGWPAHAD